jgi:hypothetical protein
MSVDANELRVRFSAAIPLAFRPRGSLRRS